MILTNTKRSKRIFASFLRTRELMPEGINLLGIEFDIEFNNQGLLISESYLMPRKKLIRAIKATMPRRGRYFFRGATIAVGSFLGFSEVKQRFYLRREIVIPPKPLEVTELKKFLGSFMGDVSVSRFIMEDPVLTIGFRDYTGREPMRSISWKQTARFGKIMVKNYDHTLDLTVTVILNADTSVGENEDILETLFSMTRTVCEFLEGSGVPYRLVTNVAAFDGIGHKHIIPDGFGSDHLTSVLELLSRATYKTFESFEDMLAKIAHTAEQGRAHILLTPEITAKASPFLQKLNARTGSETLVILPGNTKPLDVQDEGQIAV